VSGAAMEEKTLHEPAIITSQSQEATDSRGFSQLKASVFLESTSTPLLDTT